MQFYTSVSRHRNDILVSGYDENGEKLHHKHKLQPSLFIPSRRSDALTALDGTRVEEKQFDSISDATKYAKDNSGISNFEVYGMQNWVYQYIAEFFPGSISFDASLINVLTTDIEVRSCNGFPHPNQADQEVTAISIHLSKFKDTMFLFSTDAYDVENRGVLIDKKIVHKQCSNEMDLLSSFITFLNHSSCDIISGWNSEGFDIPYLVRRIDLIFGSGHSNKLSPWNIVKEKTVKNKKGEDEYRYDIVGIQQLDYMDVFKKFAVALETPENYQLNTVAELILGEGKVDYHDDYDSLEDLYLNNKQKFFDYSLYDTHLLVEMENRLKYLSIAATLAYKTGTNYQDALGTVGVWDSYIYRELRERNIAIPPNKPHTKVPYEGGYVKEPIIGLHKWLVSFDFASLYPNIIVQLNISPETLMQNGAREPGVNVDGILNRGVTNTKHPEWSMGVNGSYYNKGAQGLLAELVEKVYNERVESKGMMNSFKKKLEKDPGNEEYARQVSIYDNMQHALKIFLNSLYGAMGAVFFRYYRTEMAEAITFTGQAAIQWVERACNQYMNRILKTKDADYVAIIDTDSVYLRMDTLIDALGPKDPVEFLDRVAKDQIEGVIEKAMTDFNDRVLCGYKPRLSMKREVIASGFTVAKKHYCLNVHDDEGFRYDEPKIKIKGIAAIKSNIPKAIRKDMKETFKHILSADKDATRDFILGVKDKFYSMDVSKFAFPRGVSDLEKSYDKDTIYKKGKGTPIQVRAALLFNNEIEKRGLEKRYELIKSGDKIKFVYLKMPNPIHENVIGYLKKLPPEFELDDYIDYNVMLDKTYFSTIDPILERIGWKDMNLHGTADTSLDAFF